MKKTINSYNKFCYKMVVLQAQKVKPPFSQFGEYWNN